MKRFGMGSFRVMAAVALLAAAVALVGCGGSGSDEGEGALRVGMVTDAGTIDDRSFNQGTWEGIVRATDEFNLTRRYLMPSGTTEADYIREITNLRDAGFPLIITPGFKFETAVYQMQARYPEVNFVLIDGVPNNGVFGDGRSEKVAPNTVSIFFAEHEAGFLAAVASAVEIGEGAFGFIGGMEIPPVQRFNWGFQQGIAYANEHLGTSISLNPRDVLYQGSFDNVAAGQQIAAQMFDRGIDAIFCAAGGVGVGAINEAKARAADGAWIIGVDSDQYEQGVYADGKSVILTSAMKGVDVAAYDMIAAQLEGTFPGGETLMFDAASNGVGIPEVNPNLSERTEEKVAQVLARIQSGEIVVSAQQGDLIR
ncbi:BMP family ABC transporter substrate-binding protein [Alkalispirochaeta alkalica]|uniref:BMP family lipoprotein n=1 Tax=Alkalispirochaeta alkalica TaxID=46356 RepID=UPI0003602F43